MRCYVETGYNEGSRIELSRDMRVVLEVDGQQKIEVCVVGRNDQETLEIRGQMEPVLVEAVASNVIRVHSIRR